MKFRYQLPEPWISVVSKMEEFASGGTQVSVRLQDKRTFGGILVSNGTYVVAMRGYKDLPFALEEIEEIYQTNEDKNPKSRGGWDFWDDWRRDET
jgi:hypothetical protein